MWILGLVVMSFLASVLLGRFLRLADLGPVQAQDEELQKFMEAVSIELASLDDRGELRRWIEGSYNVVLSVRGQEVPVPLDQVFHAWRADPERLGETMEQLLTEIEESALEQPSDHPFAAVATRVLPQVRSQDWVRTNGPALGDGALVNRPLGAGLSVCYVIDDPWAVVFVCQAHLRQWGCTDEALHQLAVQNLEARSRGNVPLPEVGQGPVCVQSGDGYDAARVLLLNPEEVQGLLIGMPNEDELWLSREAQPTLESLMGEAASRESAAAAVGTSLYRIEDGQLEEFTS